MNMVRIDRDILLEDHIIVKYLLSSNTNLMEAAEAIAYGQSIGNPKVRNKWETDEMFEKYGCKIIPYFEEHKTAPSLMEDITTGYVEIAFPVINLDFYYDGLNQFMCHIMGGQLDIEIIDVCKVVDIEFPESFRRVFGLKPTYGISGIRKYLNVYERPIVGGIIKPKIGMTPEVLLEAVKEMVEGGVEFIKEDEILGDPIYCRLDRRASIIQKYLETVDRPVIYAYCINGDRPLDKIKWIKEYGANAFHYNFWGGLGQYRVMYKEKPEDMFMFFQKSGDKILTYEKNKFSIEWIVIVKLMEFMGVDFAHAGMVGGYYGGGKDIDEVLKTMRDLNIMPSLSCGMHPGLVQSITQKVGYEYMANVGGAIHGHPGGTKAGVMAMVQAVKNEHGKEYYQAIDKWGKL